MKIWIDDCRPAPLTENYFELRTVNETKEFIQQVERTIKRLKEKNYQGNMPLIELIDMDHDAGDYAKYGGDYIKVLEWLEETGRNYPIRIHSMNPVGVENMRRIIQKNGWKEVK